MFPFCGFARAVFLKNGHVTLFYSAGFSHSEIFGSQVESHLPEAYRRLPASFIAASTQGIHHLPIKDSLPNLAKFLYIILLNFLCSSFLLNQKPL